MQFHRDDDLPSRPYTDSLSDSERLEEYRRCMYTPTSSTGDKMTALKNDQDKPRMELLSVPALQSIAEVMTFGAKKYADHNWRQGFKWSRLYGAALRHLTAHMNGESTDPESGFSHLAHLGCCVMFLLEHEKCSLGTDDRYKKKEEVS